MLQMKRSRAKAKHTPFPLHVKTGDTVLVLSGKDKGKTGTVQKIFTDRSKILVEGLNIIKKATRPNPMMGNRGGIIEMSAPLAAGKLMLYCLQCSKPTRIKYDFLADNRKTRVCRHCNAQFDA